MNRAHFALTAALAFALHLSVAASSQANFHLWKFTEVFSNASGSVQFIEMQDPSDFEDQLGGMTIKSTSTGKTFTFPMNLGTTETGGQHLLIATPGFAAISGAVTPDFTLPSIGFFNPAGDTLTFADFFDSRTFPNVPTNGTQSRNYPANAIALNTPTNFAGAVGFLNLVPEPGTILLALILLGVATPRFRRRVIR